LQEKLLDFCEFFSGKGKTPEEFSAGGRKTVKSKNGENLEFSRGAA
jgi:hypothetical protein